MRASMCLAFAVRVAYFVLVAAAVLTVESPGNIVLFDLATVFYFMSLSGIVASWAAVAMSRLGVLKQRIAPIIVALIVALNALVIGVFTAMLAAALSVGVDKSSQCFERFQSVDSSTQRALIIAYMVFVGATAVLTTVVLVVLGCCVFRGLWKAFATSRLIVIMAAVAALGFVVHCALVIAITAAAEVPPPGLSLLLCSVEVLACLSVAALSVWSKARKAIAEGRVGSSSPTATRSGSLSRTATSFNAAAAPPRSRRAVSSASLSSIAPTRATSSAAAATAAGASDSAVSGSGPADEQQPSRPPKSARPENKDADF
jgi:hypothetical protein